MFLCQWLLAWCVNVAESWKYIRAVKRLIIKLYLLCQEWDYDISIIQSQLTIWGGVSEALKIFKYHFEILKQLTQKLGTVNLQFGINWIPRLLGSRLVNCGHAHLPPKQPWTNLNRQISIAGKISCASSKQIYFQKHMSIGLKFCPQLFHLSIYHIFERNHLYMRSTIK